VMQAVPGVWTGKTEAAPAAYQTLFRYDV